MSTDRELLESAAKAAGHSKSWIYEELDKQAEGHKAAWNPLTDDGDALRLVVKLKMLDLWTPAATKGKSLEGWNEDPYAATRRAIVRAAAAIGEAMP